MTPRQTVNRAVFLAVVVAFVLPFATVSCMGGPLEPVNGVSLAVGGCVTIPPGSPADGGFFFPDPPAGLADPPPWLGPTTGERLLRKGPALVALLLAAAGVTVGFSTLRRASTVLGWIGGAGFVALILLRLFLMRYVGEVAEAPAMPSFGAGWWIAMLGFAAAGLYNAATYWQPQPDLADAWGDWGRQAGRSQAWQAPSHSPLQGRSPSLMNEEAVELTEKGVCAACGSPLSPAARFCSDCGAPQPSAHPETGQDDKLCPACGVLNARSYRFCLHCGTTLSDFEASSGHDAARPADASDPAFPPGTRTRSLTPAFATAPRSASVPVPQLPGWVRTLGVQLLTGWSQAALATAGATMALFLIGFAGALAIRFALVDAWIRVGTELPLYKLAGLVLFTLARVPLGTDGVYDVPGFDARGQGDLVVSLLGGLLVIAAVLFAAGRYAASAANVTRLGAAAAQGFKIAPLLAGVAFVASHVVRVTQPQGWIGPSQTAALGWALLGAGVFATLGALTAVGGRRWLRDWAHNAAGRVRVWAHGVSAGVTAAAFGLAVSLLIVLAMLIVVAARTDTPLLLAEARPAATVTAGVAALLYLPNLAVQLLGFAHGGTYLANVSGPYLNESIQVSYLSWPGNNADPIATTWGPAPWIVFAVLAIPTLAVLWGGYVGAARSGTRSVADAQRLALSLGVSYATLLGILAVVERSLLIGRIWADNLLAAGAISVGFSPAGMFVLPFVWGLVGGYVGARIYLAVTPAAQPAVFERQAGPQTQGPALVDSSMREPAPRRDTTAGSGEPDESPAQSCQECGAANRARNRFCARCGTPLRYGSEPVATPPDHNL